MKSPNDNMKLLLSEGIDRFTEVIRKKWTCQQCGNLLSVHRKTCVFCNSPNQNYPEMWNKKDKNIINQLL